MDRGLLTCSGRPDKLMEHIPTVVVNPLPEGIDKARAGPDLPGPHLHAVHGRGGPDLCLRAFCLPSCTAVHLTVQADAHGRVMPIACLHARACACQRQHACGRHAAYPGCVVRPALLLVHSVARGHQRQVQLGTLTRGVRSGQGYVVLNRPYAFQQWAQQYLAGLEEDYVLMAEPDHIFLRPLPLWCAPTPRVNPAS